LYVDQDLLQGFGPNCVLRVLKAVETDIGDTSTRQIMGHVDAFAILKVEVYFVSEIESFLLEASTGRCSFNS